MTDTKGCYTPMGDTGIHLIRYWKEGSRLRVKGSRLRVKGYGLFSSLLGLNGDGSGRQTTFYSHMRLTFRLAAAYHQ